MDIPEMDWVYTKSSVRESKTEHTTVWWSEVPQEQRSPIKCEETEQIILRITEGEPDNEETSVVTSKPKMHGEEDNALLMGTTTSSRREEVASEQDDRAIFG